MTVEAGSGPPGRARSAAFEPSVTAFKYMSAAELVRHELLNQNMKEHLRSFIVLFFTTLIIQYRQLRNLAPHTDRIINGNLRRTHARRSEYPAT